MRAVLLANLRGRSALRLRLKGGGGHQERRETDGGEQEGSRGPRASQGPLPKLDKTDPCPAVVADAPTSFMCSTIR